MELVKLDRLPLQPIKPKLTVEHVAALLQKNYTQVQIAKHLHVSRQAVDQFVDRHYDILQPLIDNTDTVFAIRLKSEAIKVANSIDDADHKKANLLQKATTVGILIDKYRLLTNKSTDNLDIHLHAKIEDALKQLQE